jgi:hypothetical protein
MVDISVLGFQFFKQASKLPDQTNGTTPTVIPAGKADLRLSESKQLLRNAPFGTERNVYSNSDFE